MSDSDAFNSAIQDAEREVEKYNDLKIAVDKLCEAEHLLGKHFGCQTGTMIKLHALKDDVMGYRFRDR